MYSFINKISDESFFQDKTRLVLSRFFRGGIIDRTETLTDSQQTYVIDKIESINLNSTISFSENCQKRAKEILEEAKEIGSKIAVLWSGGIDSTVALVSLIKEIKKQNLSFDILEVYLGKQSLIEHPRFYKRFIMGIIKTYPLASRIPNFLDCENRLIVTGELGDQLFGSDKVIPMIEAGMANEKWDEVLPFMLAEYTENKAELDETMSNLYRLIEKCPHQINSLVDALWWMNFSLKWQHVSLRISAESEESPALFYKNTRNFFQTDAFQAWAIAQVGKRVLNNINDYKKEAKEYIYAFDQDKEYFENKTKEPSLTFIYMGERDDSRRKKRRVTMNSANDNIENDFGIILDASLNHTSIEKVRNVSYNN